MKKSLITIAILCATLSLASAGSASFVPAGTSLSKPAYVPEERRPVMQKTGLHCIDVDQCRVRSTEYLSTELMIAPPILHGAGSGMQRGRLAFATVVGLQTGGFVGGVYIPHAGAIPEGNSWIAT